MGMLLRRHIISNSGEAEKAPAPVEEAVVPSVREQADAIGLKYHPNISDEKLAAKIAEFKDKSK